MQNFPKSMNQHYSGSDIIASYEWLGHKEPEFTELVAFHRDYKYGKEHAEENKKRGSFPKIWYTTRPQAAVEFVHKFFREHTCCYGINPRKEVFTNQKGFNRRARDEDIEVVMNLYLDIDPVGEPSDEQIAELELFLPKTHQYFEDLGIGPPTEAFTGRGYHLLFAVPRIKVVEHPDIKERLNQFRQQFYTAFRRELSELELKLDNTMDLSRLAKIYGTKKPSGLRVSKFYGDQRRPDEGLHRFLLSMPMESYEEGHFVVPQELPERFRALLEQDADIRQLWEGAGKAEGDTTNSGYDFSLVKQCLGKGITDIEDLLAILMLRPRGGVQLRGKGEKYARLTIANAIKQ